MTKKMLFCLLAACLLIAMSALAACGGGEETTSSQPSPSTPQTTTSGAPETTTQDSAPTTEPVIADAVAGPISAENHVGYTDSSLCNLCHLGAASVLDNPEDHADYAPTSCLDSGCHELPE